MIIVVAHYYYYYIKREAVITIATARGPVAAAL
jgi:hypothetical protein